MLGVGSGAVTPTWFVPLAECAGETADVDEIGVGKLRRQRPYVGREAGLGNSRCPCSQQKTEVICP